MTELITIQTIPTPADAPPVQTAEPEATPAKCKKHPRYKAIRRPKTDCEACRAIYAATHPAKAS